MWGIVLTVLALSAVVIKVFDRKVPGSLYKVVLLVWAIVRVVRVPTGRVRPPAGLREIVTGRRPIPARVPTGR